MKTIAIIPARFASSRFPGKPLADIAGKTMIERVYRQVEKAALVQLVYVATDNEDIARCVRSFGGNVCLTDPDIPNGTLRCWEAYKTIVSQSGRCDVMLNVQGDEPLLNPESLDSLVSVFEDAGMGIASLRKKIGLPQELFDPNVVKVVTDKQDNALYFSRLPIPYQRDLALRNGITDDSAMEWMARTDYYKHVGIYAFRPEILSELVGLSAGILESSESLEQLRWLENSYPIRMRTTSYESLSVDVPEDIEKILASGLLVD